MPEKVKVVNLVDRLVGLVDHLVEFIMSAARKRKGAEMSVEDTARKSWEQRKRGKGEFVTPELLDTKSEF